MSNAAVTFDESDDTTAARLARIQAMRQKVLDQQARSPLAQPVPTEFTAKIVGVSFVDGYPDNVARVERAWLAANGMARSVSSFDPDDPFAGMADADGYESIPAVLIRNPDNEHDANAIQVHVPAANTMIGHLPRALASRLAPLIDAGQVWQAEIRRVLVHPDHPDRPGIEIRVWHVPPAYIDAGDAPLDALP